MCKFIFVVLLALLMLLFSPVAFALEPDSEQRVSPPALEADSEQRISPPTLDTEPPVNIPISDCCDGGDCCILNDCVCPNCEDRGEPGEDCQRCGSEVCENCGNCLACGTSPCPVCIVESDDYDEISPIGIIDDSGNADTGIPDNMNSSGETNPEMHGSNRIGNTTWAITNLILSVLGIALTVVVSLYAMREKRNHSSVHGESHMRKSAIFTITMAIVCVASIALFFFTQTITRHIVLFDNYTFIHAILFLATTFLTALMNRRIDDQKYVITQTAWEV